MKSAAGIFSVLVSTSMSALLVSPVLAQDETSKKYEEVIPTYEVVADPVIINMINAQAEIAARLDSKEHWKNVAKESFKLMVEEQERNTMLLSGTKTDESDDAMVSQKNESVDSKTIAGQSYR